MESDIVPIWSIICFILIIAANAYVVAAERALSAVNKVHIRSLAEEGNTRAEDLEKIIDDPGTYMPAMRAASVLLALCAAAFSVPREETKQAERFSVTRNKVWATTLAVSSKLAPQTPSRRLIVLPKSFFLPSGRTPRTGKA